MTSETSGRGQLDRDLLEPPERAQHDHRRRGGGVERMALVRRRRQCRGYGARRRRGGRDAASPTRFDPAVRHAFAAPRPRSAPHRHRGGGRRQRRVARRRSAGCARVGLRFAARCSRVRLRLGRVAHERLPSPRRVVSGVGASPGRVARACRASPPLTGPARRGSRGDRLRLRFGARRQTTSSLPMCWTGAASSSAQIRAYSSFALGPVVAEHADLDQLVREQRHVDFVQHGRASVRAGRW